MKFNRQPVQTGYQNQGTYPQQNNYQNQGSYEQPNSYQNQGGYTQPNSYQNQGGYGQQNNYQNQGGYAQQTGQALNRTYKASKILPKFINKPAKSQFGSGLEFNASAFVLGKINANGYRDSMDGKILLNFWTFNQNNNTQDILIPTYLDLSEWLNICHMIKFGRLTELTKQALQKQKEGNYANPSYIYQSNGGSTKAIFKVHGQPFGGKGPISTVFKITPARKENHWMLSSEIFEGVLGPTGLIERKQGTNALARVAMLMSYDDLVRVACMTEMAAQAYMNQYFLN